MRLLERFVVRPHCCIVVDHPRPLPHTRSLT